MAGSLNVLVLGLAKTGTTIISETVAHTLQAERYISEPKHIDEFERATAAKARRTVVKVLFEHWNGRPNLRRAFIRNECALKFDRRLYILRDPRDELISRLHFVVKPYVESPKFDPEKVTRWLSVLKVKETSPGDVTMLQIMQEATELFGIKFGDYPIANKGYYRFVFERPQERLLLRYENWIQGDLQELQDYLGCGPVRVDIQSRFPHRRRTAAWGNWKRYFTPADVDFFRTVHGEMFDQLGYNDWTLTPVDRLDPHFGSEYVERMVSIAQSHKQRLWRWPKMVAR